MQVEDVLDQKDLHYVMTQACSHEILPHPSGSHWRTVVLRPTRFASTHSVPSLDAIDTYRGCWIAYILCDHPLAFHLQMHPHGAASLTESRCSFILASPSYVNMVHTPISPSRNNLRSAEVSSHTCIEYPKYIIMQKVLLTPCGHGYHKMQPEIL